RLAPSCQENINLENILKSMFDIFLTISNKKNFHERFVPLSRKRTTRPQNILKSGLDIFSKMSDNHNERKSLCVSGCF
ncbi:MAG: hypothetical protein LUG15_02120, partial [Oscillospiraceae bacterium]|nr:hypothetical protein [Oscillospiraceae bacterium]